MKGYCHEIDLRRDGIIIISEDYIQTKHTTCIYNINYIQ